jgi:DNA-binding NarL/FixJ family response regulator
MAIERNKRRTPAERVSAIVERTNEVWERTQLVHQSAKELVAHSKELLRARLLIVDDHPIVRLGIRQMIGAEPHLSVCGEADSASAALEFVRASPPDLAIVDLSLEAGNGLHLIRRLHEVVPGLPVLVLSMHDEALYADRAIRAGARGYIMKQEAIDGLVHAIGEVLAGRIYLSERLLQQQGGETTEADAPARSGSFGDLTDRELEVLEMIGRGLATAEIAERLAVSVKTVETYRLKIRIKLDLDDAADLIRYAATWVERI